MQWQFTAVDAARVTIPVLVVEGAEGRRIGNLSQQVTESALKLLPEAEMALIENTNHMLPLQDPAGVGRTVADFAPTQPVGALGLFLKWERHRRNRWRFLNPHQSVRTLRNSLGPSRALCSHRQTHRCLTTVLG